MTATARQPAHQHQHTPLESFMMLIGGLVLFGAYFTFLVIGSGFVGMRIWNWFVPLAFSSAPTLGLGEAIGLNIVVGVFFRTSTYKRDDDKKLDAAYFAKAMSNLIFFWALTLLIGWIVHSIIV